MDGVRKRTRRLPTQKMSIQTPGLRSRRALLPWLCLTMPIVLSVLVSAAGPSQASPGLCLLQSAASNLLRDRSAWLSARVDGSDAPGHADPNMQMLVAETVPRLPGGDSDQLAVGADLGAAAAADMPVWPNGALAGAAAQREAALDAVRSSSQSLASQAEADSELVAVGGGGETEVGGVDAAVGSPALFGPPLSLAGLSTDTRAAEATGALAAAGAQQVYRAAVQAEKAWLRAQSADERAARVAHMKAAEAHETQLALLHVLHLEPTPQATQAPPVGPVPDGGSPAPAAKPAEASAPAAGNSTATAPTQALTETPGPAAAGASAKCGGAGQLPCTPFLQVVTLGYRLSAWRGVAGWLGALGLAAGWLSWRCMSYRVSGFLLCLCGVLLLAIGGLGIGSSPAGGGSVVPPPVAVGH